LAIGSATRVAYRSARFECGASAVAGLGVDLVSRRIVNGVEDISRVV
jgi:hypothetical protein